MFHDAKAVGKGITDASGDALLVTPPLLHGERTHYKILEYTPLLDSCNMNCKDWARIAGDIAKHYDEWDAFIVLHGTDTMAYTASALSFMLENLAKPVVLCGAMMPLALPCSVRPCPPPSPALLRATMPML